MSKIVIGQSIVDGKLGRDLKLDVDLLIPSRLLIQANSGGGKSWALRRILEALWKVKVQAIVIDPEGEFYTLREKFGYVLVGENGETPADVRSASLLAEKFLQLKASAICDLYEAFRGKPMQQRQWVRAFLSALLDAPRSLWHPLVVVVDEAHKFCPQESPKAASMTDREIIGGCKDAMVALSTTGRKRGFCAVWATQRLAKLDKDASAEFFNRMVGMTIEDVDVDRACDLMSVSKSEKADFRVSLRTLTPGQFYCFGRAIATERKLVMVGPVETHHPETGRAAQNAVAPPTPDEVKAFLPQLSDLPQQAENKARTEAEMKRELAELRKKLAAMEKKQPSSVGTAAPVKSDTHQARTIRELRLLLEEAIKISAKINAIGFDGAEVKPEEIAAAVEKAAAEVGKIAGQKFALKRRELEKLKEEVTRLLAKLNAKLGDERLDLTVNVVKNEPISISAPPVSRHSREPIPFNGDGTLSGPEGKIMRALGELLSIGKEAPPKNMVAGWAGYSPVGGAFGNPIGALRTRGLIDYPQPGRVSLTDAGRKVVGECNPPDMQEIWRRIESTCTGPEVKILRALVENAGESEISKVQLAEKAGYAPVGGAFGNPIGALRTKGLLDYPSPGMVQAADWLFVA